MRIKIYKYDYGYEVAPDPIVGSPYVGRGKTMEYAMGDFLRCYQKDIGLEIIVDESAWSSELRRRKRELAKR
jgi:hypothetical protein